MFKKDISPSSKSKLKSSAQRSIRNLLCQTYPLLAPHIELIVPKKSQLDVVKIPDARVTLYTLSGTPLFYQHMSDPLIPHLSLVHRFPDCFPRLRVDRGAIRFVISGASLMVPGFTSAGGRLPGGSVNVGKLSLEAQAVMQAQSQQAEGTTGGEDAGEEQDKDLGDGGVKGVPPATNMPTTEDRRYLEQPDFEEGTVVVVEAEGKEVACAIGTLKMGTKEMKAAKKGVGIESAHYLGDGLWRMKLD